MTSSTPSSYSPALASTSSAMAHETDASATRTEGTEPVQKKRKRVRKHSSCEPVSPFHDAAGEWKLTLARPQCRAKKIKWCARPLAYHRRRPSLTLSTHTATVRWTVPIAGCTRRCVSPGRPARRWTDPLFRRAELLLRRRRARVRHTKSRDYFRDTQQRSLTPAGRPASTRVTP